MEGDFCSILLSCALANYPGKKLQAIIVSLREFRERVEQLDVPHGLRNAVPSLDAAGFVETLLRLIESRSVLQKQSDNHDNKDDNKIVLIPQLTLLLFELLQCSDGLRYLLEHADTMNRIIEVCVLLSSFSHHPLPFNQHNSLPPLFL